jgi:hypothetical protein
VLEAGRLSGVLTAENVAEYVMIEEALHASARDNRAGGGDGDGRQGSMVLANAARRSRA